MKSLKLAFALVAGAMASGVWATDIYVKAANDGKTGLDGSSEALAYGTIQAAVDAAKDGDVIWVYPGDYNAGYTYGAGGNARVVFGKTTDEVKKLTLKSTGGKAVTRIFGALDPADPVSGIGANAARAIVVQGATKEKPVIVEGFTLMESSVFVTKSEYRNFGSAVYAESRYAYFVDCDITGNSGSRGVTYYGTFVRCCFHDNNLPNGKGTCGYKSRLLNCICVRNTDGAGLTTGLAVNCTMMDFGSVNHSDPGALGSENSVFVNSICQRALISDSSCAFSNCVVKSTGKLAYNADLSDQCYDLTGDEYQCVSPLFDDYRLIDGCTASYVGDSTYIEMIELPPEIDGYVDFYGNEIPRDSSIAAGAVQAVASYPELLGGRVTFTAATSLVGAGRSFVGGTYAHVTEYPVQWHVNTYPKAGEHLLWFKIDGADENRRAPEMDESFWFMPAPYEELTVQARMAYYAFYVDPQTGHDEPVADEVRGTAENPFETLQAAIDKGKSVSNPAVIYAAEGEYDKGGKINHGVFSRLSCSGEFRIKGAGAGRSIIKGRLDDTGVDPTGEGRGPNAIRCAALESGILQGFTLTDGRSDYGADSAATRGGGVYVTQWGSGAVYDCVITNCLAVRGSAMGYGHAYRTRIYDCSLGQARWATFHSCLFDRCGGTDYESELGGSCVAYQCTIVGSETLGPISNNSVPLYNSIILNGTDFSGGYCKNAVGCVAWNFSGSKGSGFVYQDPQLLDVEGEDYRFPASSPAMTCTSFDEEDFWKHYSSDIDSRPLVFSNGKPIAGAFHNPVGAVVGVASGGRGGFSPADVTPVEPGDEVTVTAVDGTRHVVAIKVNGELVEGTSYTYAAPADTYPTEPVSIEAVFSTNWYVNADAAVGDDANTGFTPETPKRSLEKIMGVALETGDVVHAAPGVYDQGSMAQNYKCGSGAASTPVRVCVKAGITLVGDEGAAETVIKGECTATSESNPFGGGEAMRCLNLANGARVVGFTLTGGSTPYVASSGQAEPYCGGGVIAPLPSGEAKPLVENCVISNNYACRGGGVFGGALRNCRVIDNYSSEDGNATFNTRHENVLVDLNRGKSDGACVVRYPWGVFNTTITERNISVDTGKPSQYFVYNYMFGGATGASYGMANSIIMGGSENYTFLGATNCLFNSEAQMTYGKRDNWCNCRELTLAELKLAADGVPLDDSPAIDNGENAEVVTDVALDGVQRIYNETVDIGCYEKDMRAAYAAAIGGGVTVTSASPAVKLEAGIVRLTDGAQIAGTWPNAGGRAAKMTVNATASGDGQLDGVFFNESAEVIAGLTFQNETRQQTFRPGEGDVGYAFGFTGDGYGELFGFSQGLTPLFLMLR